jgi:hypothetical protein
MKRFEDLAQANSIFSETRSAALGATVTVVYAGRRDVLGAVVQVSEDRKSAWVRRYTDGPDTAVLYSARELDLATPDELAQIGRWLVNRQYMEYCHLTQEAKETR